MLFFPLLLLMSACSESGYMVTERSHSFDDHEYYIRRFENPERARWQKPDEVVAAMKIGKGDTVADIGAATGYFTRRFARAVAPEGTATGYDIQPWMVEYMKKDARKLKLPNYRSGLIDPLKPVLPEGHFSVIFMCNTYHHIEKRVEYLAGIKSAIRKNGRFVLIDHHVHAKNGPPVHLRLSRELVISEFDQAGFRLSKSLDFLQDQYYLEFTPR
jgi:ubiquinone/menaquinone biosynthesis C-methylase UbiE